MNRTENTTPLITTEGTVSCAWMNSTENTTALITTEGTLSCAWMPISFRYFYIAVRFLEGLLAIAGNSLTIGAVATDEGLREDNVNLLIASLALADLISGFVPPFVFLKDFFRQRNAYMWKMMRFMDVMINSLSSGLNVTSICAIAVDRFLFIVYPLRYDAVLTRSRVLTAILMVWIILSTYILLMFTNFFRFESMIPCVDENNFTFAVLWYGIWLPFLVFTAVTIVLYSGVSCIAMRHARALGQVDNMTNRFRRDGSSSVDNSNGQQSVERPNMQEGIDPNKRAMEERTRTGYKVTKMMSLVLGIYLAAYLPYLILSWAITKESPIFLRVMDRVSSRGGRAGGGVGRPPPL